MATNGPCMWRALISYRRQFSNICVKSTTAFTSTCTEKPMALPAAIAFVSRCQIKNAINGEPVPRTSSTKYLIGEASFLSTRDKQILRANSMAFLQKWPC